MIDPPHEHPVIVATWAILHEPAMWISVGIAGVIGAAVVVLVVRWTR